MQKITSQSETQEVMIGYALAFLLVLGLGEAASPWHNSNCIDGRVAIVHLFEWKWNDIARECEEFLGPMGFCGVQVSPPAENAVITDPVVRPWWERYQPVSYKLETRSGTEDEFKDMVRRCNNVDVRIYVDAIVNHMCGVGKRGIGTGGSEFDSDIGHFPEVPYTMDDFNDCSSCDGCCCVNAWTEFANVRNCRLVGLIDLDQSKQHVRQGIAGYFNKLVDIGVAGFRVDASKHMWPEDILAIQNMVNGLNTEYFSVNSQPFFYHEVIHMNQNNEIRGQDYAHLGRVTDFRYSNKISNAVEWLGNVQGIYDPAWGMLESADAFVFVDNHDSQRGHGPGGDNTVTYKRGSEYKIAQAIAHGWGHGYPRMMSSFEFTNSEAGPPMNADQSIKDVVINSDGTCGNGWVCEHRWPAIAGMASFAKAANGRGSDNWWNVGNAAAWGRGGRAFIAITKQTPLQQTFNTGLPSGLYCNVIQGCPTSNGCQGESVQVDGNGRASISITDSENPIVAIHVEATSGSGSCISGGGPAPTFPTIPTGPTSSPARTTAPGPSTPPPTPGEGYLRTVVLVERQTNPGQDLFIRGGISHDRRQGCNDNAETSPCAISISHNSLGSSSHYDKYDAWRVGDTKLDWYGSQVGQGLYQGQRAEGTPTAWTSSQQGNPGYQELNRFGDHYWMVDVEMNCDETQDGWFEMKAFVTGQGWEGDIYQNNCGGTAGGSPPYSGNNHFARCGFVNVFTFNSGSCLIDNF